MRPVAPLVPQFVRFAIVGAGNTLLGFAAYGAYLAVGVPYLAASALAFAAGAVNGYLANSRWTFRAGDSWRACSAYLAIQAVALALNTGLVWIAVHTAGVPALAAYAVAVPPVTVLTFLASRALVFTPRRLAAAQLSTGSSAWRDQSCHEPG